MAARKPTAKPAPRAEPFDAVTIPKPGETLAEFRKRLAPPDSKD